MKPETALLGAHIAAGVIWFAAVTKDGQLVDDSPDRLELVDLPDGRGLAELEESIESVLNRLNPGSVVLLDAGSSDRPAAPSRTRRRTWLESALMIASARTSNSFSCISHVAVKNQLGVGPTASSFKQEMAARLKTKQPPRWGNRAPAFGAAIAELEKSGS